jgi:hypothetical protein
MTLSPKGGLRRWFVESLLLFLAPLQMNSSKKAPAHRPGALPAERPGALPAERPGALPAERPGALPAERPGALPGERERGRQFVPQNFRKK